MCTKSINVEATGHRIKEMMKERDITPKDVQRELNLDSVQAIYRWMSPKCKSIPSIDNLIQLTELFGCKIEDIIVVNAA